MWVSQGQQNNNEVFNPADKKILYQTKAATDVSVTMKYVFQFSLQNYKQKSIGLLSLLLKVFPNLHPVCSFHNTDLLIIFCDRL